MTLDFKEEGNTILLVGRAKDCIHSSEYLHKIRGVEFSPAPYFNIGEEKKLHEAITAFIKKGCIQSAHDVSEGGIFISLIESSFYRGLGFDVSFNPHYLEEDSMRNDSFWFGEAQGRVVVSVSDEQMGDFLSLAEGLNIEIDELGRVTSGIDCCE